MLSLEAYWKALNPNQVFSCDVDQKLSCSTVAASWQSTLLHWPGGGAIPNAFIGLAMFSVLLTLGVIIACGVKLPVWVQWGLRLGMIVEIVFSTWLLWQSMFVIGAMCPWCLTMDVGSIILMIGVLREWSLSHAEQHPGIWRFTSNLESLLVNVVILLAFGLIVTLHYFS
jgi:uncharacterized membrane protein